MNRAKSRSFVVRSQVAAGVLLMAGAAIALSPSPFGGTAPTSTYKEPAPPPARNTGPLAPLDVNLASSLVAISVQQPSEKPIAPPPPPNPEDAAPEVAKTIWEYIGGLIGPSTRRAVVTLSGDQRMVSEGDTLDGVRVNAITRDFIMVEEGGAEKRIDRKNRIERVAVISAPASGMANAVKNPSPKMGGATANGAGRKVDRSPEGRAKQRNLYMEAVRASNFSIPDAEMLGKFGLTDFEPTEQEMDGIIRHIKDAQSGALNRDKTGE